MQPVLKNKKEIIFPLLIGAATASIFVASCFFVYAWYLVELYIAATGNLLFTDKTVSRGILHFFGQAFALGGAGGYLHILQIIFAVSVTNKSSHSSATTWWEYVILGFLFPIRGVIAGALAGAVIGGGIFYIGGIDALTKASLLLLGVCGLAGYREQVLQRIVIYGSEHARWP